MKLSRKRFGWCATPASAVATLVLIACGGSLHDQGDGGQGLAIGAACTASSDCASNQCDTALSGGYCVADCGSGGSCPSGATCGQSADGTSMCFLSCTRNTECRIGYVCDTTQGVCLPPASGSSGCESTGCPSGETCDSTTGACVSSEPAPDGGAGALTNVGAACSGDSQCVGGTQPFCLTASQYFSDGYCSAQCSTDSDCGSGGACVSDVVKNASGQTLTACVQSCTSSSDCRSGYTCTGSGQMYCFPDDCRVTPAICTSEQTCNQNTGTCITHTGPPPIALSGCSSTGYYTKVDIGSQSFQVVLDSGSATLAVASSGCDNCSGVSPLYSPGSSATDTGQNAQATYGDGSGWSGEIYKDTTKIVGADKAVDVDLVGITNHSSFFSDFSCDLTQTSSSPTQGILGLGPSDLLVTDTDAYFGQLYSAGGITDLFSIQLCALGGSLWLGGFDTGSMVAAPQYAAIQSMSQNNPYYSVHINGMSINGTSVGTANDLGPVVIDTGTSVFSLPTSVFTSISNTVGGLAAFKTAFPGQTASSFFSSNACIQAAMTPEQLNAALPPLKITFQGTSGGSFTLSAPATTSYLSQVNTSGTTLYCSGIDDGGSQIGETIFGDSILNSFVVIFDLKNNRIGLGEQQGCP